MYTNADVIMYIVNNATPKPTTLRANDLRTFTLNDNICNKKKKH